MCHRQTHDVLDLRLQLKISLEVISLHWQSVEFETFKLGMGQSIRRESFIDYLGLYNM